MKQYIYNSLVSLLTASLLMLSLQLAGQNNGLSFLQNKVENYTKNNIQEKLYIHTDKNFYVANEICWFKIYNVDAILNKPLNISKIAYLELIDNNSKAVWQEKIALNEATGSGSILIPSTIATGKYTLRAYTNWMKNFNADFFFEKKISILNPTLTQENNYTPPKENYSIQIFPEGGNLVVGQEAKLAFKIVNQLGKGVQAKGYLLNEKGDTISHCTTSSLGIGSMGIGSFQFTPQSNHSYSLSLTTDSDKMISQPLPKTFDKGYSLSLINTTDSASDKIKVKIAGIELENTNLYLLVHSRGIVTHTMAGQIINGSCSLEIDKNKLNEGINIITLFNQAQEPVCERLYFNYPKNILEASLDLESTLLEKRKKVNLQIATKQINNDFAAANLSMAVYKIDSIQTIDENNIQNYIWLSSDLSGHIENPASYFQNNNSNTLLAMDELMLVNGWRRFKWETVLAGTNPSFKYLPELAGSIITGKMVQKGSTTPIKDITGFISMPSKNTFFKVGISDENGNIKFEFPHLYNDGQVILQADSSKYNTYKIEIDNPFYISKNNSQIIEPILLPKLNKEIIQQLNSNIEIQNHFKPDNFNHFISPNIDSNAFYYKPDYTYYLDLYARFTTMEEVIREYVTPISLTKNEGRFQLAVYDDQNKRFFDKAPLVLLDGVPILNMDKFIEYDPLKIRKLEVVSRTYFLGNMAFNGIANFITYNGKMEGYELDPRATLIDYKGLQMQREFMAPVYENQNQIDSRMPDFRHLLNWSANINTTSKGKINTAFYTSDVPGKYAIVLQGISKQGHPIYKQTTFTVK
ncbi:MAG: hypothetical protein K9G06_01340 [Chitinophagaceae bacterium]|nr:hypothetical protein [Chitinophagaceae bacterium]